MYDDLQLFTSKTANIKTSNYFLTFSSDDSTSGSLELKLKVQANSYAKLQALLPLFLNAHPGEAFEKMNLYVNIPTTYEFREDADDNIQGMGTELVSQVLWLFVDGGHVVLYMDGTGKALKMTVDDFQKHIRELGAVITGRLPIEYGSICPGRTVKDTCVNCSASAFPHATNGNHFAIWQDNVCVLAEYRHIQRTPLGSEFQRNNHKPIQALMRDVDSYWSMPGVGWAGTNAAVSRLIADTVTVYWG